LLISEGGSGGLFAVCWLAVNWLAHLPGDGSASTCGPAVDEFTNGKRLLIGSQRPEELAAAITQAKQGG